MALSNVDFKDFIRAGVGMSAPANRLATAINAIITDIDALRYAQVTIPNGATTYNAAAPAGWVNGKPTWACISNATTNPVAVMSSAVAAGNLIVALGGVNAGVTGDPGASGATIEVWQDGR